MPRKGHSEERIMPSRPYCGLLVAADDQEDVRPVLRSGGIELPPPETAER
jgi:hypothetical protein